MRNADISPLAAAPRATMPAKQAAAYVGVSYWKLLEWAKAGKVPHIRTDGGRLLFRRETLDAWLAEQEQASLRPELEPTGKIRRLK